MSEQKIRNVFIYKNYFFDFFEKQRQKVKDKILWTIKLIETIDKIPTEYFKHLEGTNGLYEIRVQHGSDISRIFCFFDDGKLIILINAFQKKTQKATKKEIEKALKIKEEYQLQKNNKS